MFQQSLARIDVLEVLTMNKAIVGIYFVQVIHVAGNGLLSTAITSVVGGGNKATWLVSTTAITAAALGPPVSQASDYWGRKWFAVSFTVLGAVGCLIASRANSFGVLIAGQSIGSLALGAQPLAHAIPSES
jgi:predicted MFS family arabinose efflux permease